MGTLFPEPGDLHAAMDDPREQLGFTLDDLAQAEHYASLGPEYFASERIVHGVLAELEPNAFKPLVERAIGEIQEVLWNSVRDHLLNDTSMNLQGHIQHMVEQTVFALLQGHEWALQRYPLARYHDGQSVRMAIIEHCGAALIEKVERDEDADARYLADRYRAYRNIRRQPETEAA